MPKRKKLEGVLSPAAPEPIGPYSQAIVANGFVFCSGQIPLDPKTGQLAAADVEGQARRVMENLKAVLEAAGSDFGQVVRTTIYLKSMNDFPKVNEVYGSYFGEPAPARATIEVARLPRDVLVEIDAIAMV